MLASEIFCLTADSDSEINSAWLEHPDDEIFKNLLMGFAKTGKAKDLLIEYSDDEEFWVRCLSKKLIMDNYENRKNI